MIDILAIGAHPDDCEMFMGGTLLKMKSMGYKSGICSLTQGELSTYGSPSSREKESQQAAKMLKLDARITLDIPDGFIKNSEEHRLQVIEVLRKLQPRLIFSFCQKPLRHPDHFHCGELVRECCFLAGLQKIKTHSPSYRPEAFLGFPELLFDNPDFIIDVTNFWEVRQRVIGCYKSQVIPAGDDDSTTKTFIRSNRFWEIQKTRGEMAGALAGITFGEPFYSQWPPKIIDPLASFTRQIY